MVFKDLLEVIPDGQYIKIEVDGLTNFFIKGHKTTVDLPSLHTYPVEEVRSIVIVTYDIEVWDEPLFRNLDGLHISLGHGS